MRNANWTRILTILLSLLALYALLAVAAGLLERFFTPLLLLILAAVLAYILTPVVDLLQTRFRLHRSIAIASTYLSIACLFVILGYFMTAPLITQTKSLTDAIRNPTHIENVQRVRSTTATALTEANLFQSYLNSDARCRAARLIGAISASRVKAACPTYLPYKKDLHKLAELLQRQYVPQLGNASVLPTKPSQKSRGGQAPIPTTRVPPSWTKKLRSDLPLLVSAIHRARRDIRSATFSPPDGVTVAKAARIVDRDSRSLYSTVKSTPILILALQNGIDQHGLPIDLHSLFGKAVGKIGSQGSTLLNNAVTILTSTITVIFDLFIVIIISLYMLADGGKFIGWLMGLVPEGRREQAWFFMKSLDSVLGGYIRGQVVVAITIGVLAGVGCYALGVPYALLIGIFAFLAESIPVIGPVLASIPAILVSLFTQSFLNTLLVVAWFIIIQQIEQNVVGPRITGHAVGIHPVAAMVAILIGIEVGGFWGAFLAVPAAGILQVVVRETYNVLILQRPISTATVPDTVEIIEADDRGSGMPPAAH